MKPFCILEELDAQSTVFEFDPKQFNHTRLVLNGETNRGGHITVGQRQDGDASQARVTVTVYAGTAKRHREVEISAFEEAGAYVVQLERHHVKHARHPHREPKQKDCLVYSVLVEFPVGLTYYDAVSIQAKKAQRIQGGDGIKNIDFGLFEASLGWGAIIFDSLYANKIRLAVLYGVVMGTYEPKHHFLAASVKGATKVHLTPTSDRFNVTVASTFGPATVDIPAEIFQGDFSLHRLLGPEPTIKAPHPELVHVTRSHFGGKEGYYRNASTGSNIVISAKINGSPSLYLNE
ncbi:hypothetical protein BY458DRAFT_569031 [Sporodiniella umbellata]|nr:hypothetical protein BY458DRAFT_569031 [Sporodiniella umbellata]